MKVVVLSRDLIIASRILEAATRSQHSAQLVGDPSSLPAAASVDLLCVNWSDRTSHWAHALRAWCATAAGVKGPRLVIFGPHTDLVAHAEVRTAGLGSMLARSAFLRRLPTLMRVSASD